jgi:ABC-2 type transport system permease protein
MARIWQVLAKDLRLGPRSPLLLWALVVPVLLTLFVRGVFGGLFAAEPRLGIVDEGASEIAMAAGALDGIDVTLVEDAETLFARVESGNLDAGIVLSPGFDDAVRAGERPRLELRIAGESLAWHRVVLVGALLGLVRTLDDSSAPVDVEVVALGEAGLELELRLLPLIVIMAVAIAGAMVPAASIAQEKERRTLDALLVSPTSMSEVLVAKGVFGWAAAMAAGLITLAFNDAFGGQPVATVLAVALGGLMMVQIGLILGCWAPDTNTLFAAWKGGAVLLFYPVIFYVWPGLPTWPAQLGPTYYFLRPLFAVGVEGAGFAEVAVDLAIAAGICVLLVPLVVMAGRRLERRLGEGRIERSASLVGAGVA